MWPLLSIRRSRSGQSGFFGSCLSTWKYSAVNMSAMPRGPAVWPDFASASISITVCRMSLAFSARDLASASVIMPQLYSSGCFFHERRIGCGRFRGFGDGASNAEATSARLDEFLDIFFADAAIYSYGKVGVFRMQLLDTGIDSFVKGCALLAERWDRHQKYFVTLRSVFVKGAYWCVQQ